MEGFFFPRPASFCAPRRAALFCGPLACVLALAWFGMPGRALAVPPNPPSFLIVNAQPGGSPAFRLRWDDNSNDETGFEVQAKLPASVNWSTLSPMPGPNNTGYVSPQSAGTTVQFRVRAVKNAEVSAFSPIVECTLGTTSAIPPAGLYAVIYSDDALVTWADNVYDEDAYEIETRLLPSGSFSVLGARPADNPFLYLGGLFVSGAGYEMRVRNAYGTPGSYTYSGYSNTISFTGPTLGAPANLAGMLTNERTIGFTQQDNGTWESGFEIQVRVAGEGDGSFALLGTVGANFETIVPVSVFDPGTNYEFRSRAYYQPGGSPSPTHYSAYSNIEPVSTVFFAPTSLNATAVSKNSVNLTWTDNSSVEEGYAIYRRVAGGGGFQLVDAAGPGATSHLLQELTPGTEYEFQVRAVYEAAFPPSRSGFVNSAASNTAAAATLDAFLGSDHPVIEYQQAFAYDIDTSTQFPLTQLDVTTSELPAGLSYNPGTASISGMASEAGLFVVPIMATFGDGTTDNMDLTLRIVLPPGPPQAGAVIADQVLNQGDTPAIDLTDKFADADTESAVRIETTKGTVDVVLYPTAMPLTVANFMGYVTRADYDNTVFYRAATGFVLQGGDYVPTSPPDNFTAVVTTPSPLNEPGISHLRGTVSLAKRGGEPNSAGNDFFFNLDDNSANLNFQNGGFPVLGRVAGAGMTVVDSIAALPQRTYTVNINGFPVELDNWPMDAPAAPPLMDQSLLVRINSVRSVDPLSYSVTGNTAPGVASATVNGADLEITCLSPGITTIEVTATDLDGNTVAQTFDVTVNQSFTQWAAAEAIPGGEDGPMDNPDVDFFTNVGEWAFLGNPLAPVDPGAAPVAGFKNVSGTDRASVTFKLRKFTTGLTYRVQKSSDLDDWSTSLWSSSDGFAAPNVSTQDFADHVLVTVWDDGAGTASPCFLRIQLSLAAP